MCAHRCSVPHVSKPRLRDWRGVLALVIVLGLLGFVPPAATAAPGDLYGPPGSEMFGNQVVVLANGNFVVTDPWYDLGSRADVGAVYLYNGRTKRLISTLTGSYRNDMVGLRGVTALPNGNFVVASPAWGSSSRHGQVGAATWVNGTTGLNGVVSPANSLVGSISGDDVGEKVVALPNSNYLVSSPAWNLPGAVAVGAVTLGNGTTGTTGTVSLANSLIGGSANDQIGGDGITLLTNGNYVVNSSLWDGPGAVDAGATTWGNGTTGTTGTVSLANSLIGTHTDDRVGYMSNVTALTNGNYVVCTHFWNQNDPLHRGAATWANGATGIHGAISSANSLIGDCSEVVALTNGNYVVASPNYSELRGAATWGDGATGITGFISPANSLIGFQPWAWTGTQVVALQNGNYVVVSTEVQAPEIPDAGAVTWGDGQRGTVGIVSRDNSFVGTKAGLQLQVVPLTNGNYVISDWLCPSNLATKTLRAVTWVDGSIVTTGVVSTTNSLLTPNTGFSDISVVALSNGNYVVSSPYWDASTTPLNIAAVTWGDGTVGTIGVISTTTSLVGNSANGAIGLQVVALTNGNYVIASPHWSLNANFQEVGAVTWANGTGPTTGVVSTTNSLIGNSDSDLIGDQSITPLPNGDYLVNSTRWYAPGGLSAAAITWGNGTVGTIGTVLNTPSIIGEKTKVGHWWPPTQYNPVYHQILAGIPGENRVAILQMIYFTSTVPPSGEVGWPYQYTLTASGAPALQFRIVQGRLPPGLVLEPNGILHGTPTQAGAFAFTVIASNGIQPDATQPFTFTVALENTHTWLPVAGR